MLSQYTLEQEFIFEISGKKIGTIHNPILGKRNSLFESVKSKDNIYGIQYDIKSLQEQLGITDLNYEKAYQKIIKEQNEDDVLKILNYVYLQNNYYILVLCLYHKSPLVRKTAFTLLCNGFEVNPLIMSFFQAAFSLTDPYKVLIFPENFKADSLTFLNRETVRWITSLYRQTNQNKIWQRYNSQDINASIETQKNFISTIDEADSLQNKDQVINSIAIDSIFKRLQNLPFDSKEAIADKNNKLMHKWLHANSRVITAHKFLERLIEKWDEKEESEFSNTFFSFLSNLPSSERHIFFVYGASSEQINIMSLSFKYITQVSPITMDSLNTNQKLAQIYVKAIIQSKYYGEARNKDSFFIKVNDHFNDLMIQLKEVEDIFIPINNEVNPAYSIPTLEATPKSQVRKLNYPHQKGFFKSFHFEPGKPSRRFAQLLTSEPCSALEIQGISGMAIVLSENKTRTTTLPSFLPNFEFKAKIAFKPSNKFDLKYFKVNKDKLKAKAEKTLADIFGDTELEELEKPGLTLEQILNNKTQNKKPGK